MYRRPDLARRSGELRKRDWGLKDVSQSPSREEFLIKFYVTQLRFH